MRKVLSMVMVITLMLSMAAACAEAKEGWENILLMGGDSRKMDSFGRTDSMIILSINREESLVKMTSIMRDTWVELPEQGGQKINAANVFGGTKLAVDTVNKYFGTDIEDYVIVNMEDLIEIIDEMGGVDIEITSSEAKQINQAAESYIKEVRGASAYTGARSVSGSGMQHLNGLLAMSYCRNRHSDSDYGRVMRQQKVLLALAAKAQDMEIEDLTAVADDIYEIISTSLDQEELRSLATALMVMDVEEVEQYRVPVDGTFQSGMFSGIWMIRPDFEANQKLLHTFIYGE